MEVRCQNARFRFMPCTEYGAAVRKKQGSCIHLPDGFGTGFPPNNSEKPFSGLPFPSFSRPKNVFHELCPFLCGEFFFAFKRLKNHSLEIKYTVLECINSVYTVYLFILSRYLEAFFPAFLVGSHEKGRTNPIVRPYFGRVFISSTGPAGCLWYADLRLCFAR